MIASGDCLASHAASGDKVLPMADLFLSWFMVRAPQTLVALTDRSATFTHRQLPERSRPGPNCRQTLPTQRRDRVVNAGLS
jgi:hypothetical protein